MVNSKADKQHATKVAAVSPGGAVQASKAKQAYSASGASNSILPMGQKALAIRAKAVLSPLANPKSAL